MAQNDKTTGHTVTVKLFPKPEEISKAISSMDKFEDHYFAQTFRSIEGEQDAEKWKLLAQIFDFHFRAGEINEPFGPMTVMDGKRSLIPEDLTDDQLDELEATLSDVTDPEYIARVADVLWLRKRDPVKARIAVEAYLRSAERLEDLVHWPSSMERYERALRLAKQIEPNGDLPQRVLSTLEGRVNFYNGEDPSFFCNKAMDLLAEFKFGDFPKIADLAQRIAEQAMGMSDFSRAREYFDAQAQLLNLAKDHEGHDTAKARIVESFIQEAETREAEGSAMAAHSFWQDAIKASREVPSLRERIPELQKRLSAAGEKLVGEMKEFSHEIDISEYVKHTQEKISGLDWEDAFCTFVSSESILSPDDLRKEAEKTIAQSPLQAMVPAEMFDVSGRKVGVRPSAVTDDPEQYERAVTGFVEWHAGLHRGVIVAGYIVPGLKKLKEEHDVTVSSVINLISSSPFIPTGRETLFFQGATAGFDFDFSTALHVLVPQLENALRELLRISGVDPFNVDNDGVQEAWGFTRLLSNETLIKIIGLNNIFELRSLLIEPLGQNIRNILAHGLAGPETFNSDSAIYLWWLILRLILWPSPTMKAFIERRKVEIGTGQMGVVS